MCAIIVVLLYCGHREPYAVDRRCTHGAPLMATTTLTYTILYAKQIHQITLDIAQTLANIIMNISPDWHKVQTSLTKCAS